jgi:hypothetical protein
VANDKMLEKLRQAIITRQTLNGNKCGTTVVSLVKELDIDINKAKELLNELHARKIIRIRQGVNNKLIFLRSHLSRLQ